MYLRVFLVLGAAVVVLSEKSCYFNSLNPYLLYSTKTPYDTVRGDIRDIAAPNCEAVSLWHLQRHGNRNPGDSVTTKMKYISTLRDEIVQSYDAGRGELCAQDIDGFRKYTWNSTLETSISYLTGRGYEEIFDIATRIRQRYPELLNGTQQDYYFRPTQEQRTITSGVAFMHGYSEGTNLTNLVLSAPSEHQDIIRPYADCERYQDDVKNGPELQHQLNLYDTSDEFVAIRARLQSRLGITTQLKNEDVYSFYEMCRFERSWSPLHHSPWCSVFTDEELVVLEFRDDVRHYWRNAYGSWVNILLGGPAMKDLYDNMEAAVQGGGRKATAYFTHDTMLEMAFCALNVFNDNRQLNGDERRADRQFRTSYIAAFSTNLMAVLYRCTESSSQVYRVQLLVNEKPIEICRPPGCTWDEFKNIFQRFNSSNLDFCNPNSIVEMPENYPINNGNIFNGFLALIVLLQGLILLR